MFERMSTGTEDVSLASTLASLYADRDDLPKNLPKTPGQESKTSTSVLRVSFKNVFVLSSLSYLIPTRSWSVRVVGQALILSAQITEPYFLGWPCVHGWLWDSRRHSTLWPEGWVIREALHLPSYGLVLRQRQWRHCSHSNTVSSGAQRDQPNMDAKRYGNGLDLRKNVAAECWHAVASSKYIVAWPLPYPVVKISSTTLPVQLWEKGLTSGSCGERLCTLVDLITLLLLISSPDIPMAPFLTLSKGVSFLLRGTRCILHSRPVRAMVAPFTRKVYFAVFRYPIHLSCLNLVPLMSSWSMALNLGVILL